MTALQKATPLGFPKLDKRMWWCCTQPHREKIRVTYYIADFFKKFLKNKTKMWTSTHLRRKKQRKVIREIWTIKATVAGLLAFVLVLHYKTEKEMF